MDLSRITAKDIENWNPPSAMEQVKAEDIKDPVERRLRAMEAAILDTGKKVVWANTCYEELCKRVLLVEQVLASYTGRALESDEIDFIRAVIKDLCNEAKKEKT